MSENVRHCNGLWWAALRLYLNDAREDWLKSKHSDPRHALGHGALADLFGTASQLRALCDPLGLDVALVQSWLQEHVTRPNRAGSRQRKPPLRRFFLVWMISKRHHHQTPLPYSARHARTDHWQNGKNVWPASLKPV